MINIYNIILLSLIGCSLYFDFKPIRNTTIKIYKLFFILFGFLCAFRYGVGADTIYYMDTYYNMPALDELSMLHFIMFRFQPLYTLLCAFCKTITDNFFLIQLIQAFLLYHSLYLVIKEYKAFRFFILILFFLQFFHYIGLGLMRECFAVSFSLYSFIYYKRNKNKTALIFLLCAFFFHVGAFILFIYPLIRKVEYTPQKIILLGLLLPIIGVVIVEIINKIIAASGINALVEYSDRYLDEVKSSSNIILNYVKNSIILFLVIIPGFKYDKENKDLYILSFLFVLFDIISSQFLPMFFRFRNYVFLFFFISIHKALRHNLRRNHLFKFICFITIIYQPIVIYKQEITDKNSYLIPYKTIFSEDKSYYNNQRTYKIFYDYIRTGY